MSDSLPSSLIPPAPDPVLEMETRARVLAVRGQAARLAGLIALVSDGASGLGQAVAVGLAREGAHVAIAWLNEPEAAAQTMALIEGEGQRGLSVPGDIGNPDFAAELVRQTVAEFGRIDVLVNNTTERHECVDFDAIPDGQIEHVFRTNVLGPFWLTKAALPHMAEGSCIINTSAAERGVANSADYTASGGAVNAFTRSLALQLAPRSVRVNAVSPGLDGDPERIAASYIFLASGDAAMTGQTLEVEG